MPPRLGSDFSVEATTSRTYSMSKCSSRDILCFGPRDFEKSHHGMRYQLFYLASFQIIQYFFTRQSDSGIRKDAVVGGNL